MFQQLYWFEPFCDVRLITKIFPEMLFSTPEEDILSTNHNTCSGFTPTGKKHRWNFWASPFSYYKEKPASDRRFLQAFREGVSEEKNVWEKSVFFSESYLFCLIRQGRGRAGRQWRDLCRLRSWDCCPPGRSGPLSPVVVGYKSGDCANFQFYVGRTWCLPTAEPNVSRAKSTAFTAEWFS